MSCTAVVFFSKIYGISLFAVAVKCCSGITNLPVCNAHGHRLAVLKPTDTD